MFKETLRTTVTFAFGYFVGRVAEQVRQNGEFRWESKDGTIKFEAHKKEDIPTESE